MTTLSLNITFLALFRLLNYFYMLIIVLFISVLGTEIFFYHLTSILNQSIRSMANEGTESWPQARRNGKVWASDLFRPGVYFNLVI